MNEQEEWFRRTRDLIAETIPSPVTVTDTVNAVQQAQWHRGTKKGIEMAKSLYDEVKALADNKIAAVPNEKYRLMWLGRGVWFNLAFYQHFEEKYGATFVWTQYLGQAADSFIRYGVEENPLRSLATRFAYLYENLHITPMNAEWYVKEAKHNKVDGVVYLVTENCMNNGDFAVNIIRRLEEEGFPVCVLHADPADAKKWDQDKMVAMVEEHIEKRIIPRKQENVL